MYALDADYSTIEARIMCSMAGCKGMIEKLKNPDTDYHRQKASDMFNVPYELVTSQLRQMSKGVNFGILYGLGDPNLGKNLFGEKSPENTRKAKMQKELYYKGMEELKPFTEESRNQGLTLGYSTTFFKRRRYYNQAKTRKDTIARQSCNARIQGTAADIYKLGMVRLFNKIKKNGWVGKFLISAFVHDEGYCEVSKSINPFLALKVVREAMMLDIEGWTTLFTGEGLGSTWYEAKKTEIPVQVQVELTEKYADNCPEWWDGDIGKLSKFVVDSIENYKRDRVLNYLSNSDNWGKVMQPTENELMHELLKDIKGGQEVDGALLSEYEIPSDIVEVVDLFLRVFGREDLVDKVEIKRPVLETGSTGLDEESELLEEDEVNPLDIVKMRLNTMGVVSSRVSGKQVMYFRLDNSNPTLMGLVKKAILDNPGDIEVRTFQGEDEMSIGLGVNPRAYPKVLSLYLADRNIRRV